MAFANELNTTDIENTPLEDFVTGFNVDMRALHAVATLSIPEISGKLRQAVNVLTNVCYDVTPFAEDPPDGRGAVFEESRLAWSQVSEEYMNVLAQSAARLDETCVVLLEVVKQYENTETTVLDEVAGIFKYD